MASPARNRVCVAAVPARRWRNLGEEIAVNQPARYRPYISAMPLGGMLGRLVGSSGDAVAGLARRRAGTGIAGALLALAFWRVLPSTTFRLPARSSWRCRGGTCSVFTRPARHPGCSASAFS